MGNQYARKSIEWVVNENNCLNVFHIIKIKMDIQR